jgi:hypothetical protein
MIDLATAFLNRREALARGPQPAPVPRLPPAGATWNPTPTREESDRIALDPSDIVRLKVWDGSPIIRRRHLQGLPRT